MASRDYISREELLEELLICKARKEENPDWTPMECLTPKMMRLLDLLVERFSNHRWYNGYSWLDDMKEDARLALYMNYMKFDPSKTTNTFSYYTSIVKNAFMTTKDKELRQRDIKDKILEANGYSPSSTKQIENELSMMSEELDGTKNIQGTKFRRGRKPKAHREAQKELDERIKYAERQMENE